MKKFLKSGLLISFCTLIILYSYGQKEKINRLTKKEKKNGWVLLFDGQTSNGWTKTNGQPVAGKGWKISDGAVTIVEGEKGGDIVTVDEYADFELSVDFLLTKTANSGIKYFYTNYPTGGALGMEFQVMDDVGASDNKLANHLCGSLYDIFPADTIKKKVSALGEWNTARIVCKGKHVEHWLNGIKILEFERDSEAYLSAVTKSKYKTVPLFGTVAKGKIVLQEHGHEVAFRNIKIRKL